MNDKKLKYGLNKIPAIAKLHKHTIIVYALCILSSIIYCTHANAQDLHFSQWNNAPLLTNPANTGFIPDADYRLAVNYRNQYVSLMSSPYRTMSIWGDVQVMRERITNGWLGIGGVILRDAAGSGNLTSTKVYGSIAYHQMLGYSSLLSGGFNIGWAQKRVDPSKLTFPDQFNTATGFFDASMPTSVVFNATSINYLDMQVGLNYAYFPTENIYINAGFSAMHVNQPKEGFFLESASYDNRIAPRYTGFINASVKVSDMVILNPTAYYTNQATASQLASGLAADFNVSGDGSMIVGGGVFYRVNDAVIPQLSFELNDWRLNFSYDATMSNLKDYNGGRGAFEFSIIKKGFFPSREKRQSLCPSFKH